MGEWWSNWIATLRKGHAIGDNSPLTVNSIAADDRIAELEQELAALAEDKDRATQYNCELLGELAAMQRLLKQAVEHGVSYAWRDKVKAALGE